MLLVATLSWAGCRKEGVIPPELKQLGSLRSDTFVARHVYPARGVALEVMAPRLGTPAMLDPSESELEIDVYSAPGGDHGDLGFFLMRQGSTGDATIPLPLSASPVCDADGVCTAQVDAEGSMVRDEPLTLCARRGPHTDCRPGAVYAFSSLPAPLRMAVIADPHLGGIEGEPRISRRLERLFETLRHESPPVHVALLAGDVGHEGERSQERRFARLAAASGIPIVAVPGNHDYKDGHIVEYLVHVTPFLDHLTRIGPYAIIGLNSGPGRYDEEPMTAQNESVGLEDEQLAWLDSVVEAHAGPKVVLMHHPPYAFSWSVLGSNRKGFVRCCARSGVSLILTGHTHLNEVYDRHGIPYELDPSRGSSPSPDRLPLTLITARSTDKGGGYRLVEVFPDGGFRYSFRRVALD